MFLTMCVAAANASIIVSTGNSPSGTEQNVLFSSGTSGTTITGTTNQTNTTVSFASSTSLSADASGQSMITATSGSFNNITIGVPSGTVFTDLIFALSLTGNGTSCASCLTFTASANEPNGTVTSVTAPGTFGLGPGTNFFTATATSGETLNSFMITSTSPLADLRQVRISGIPTGGGGTGGSPVPEPATYLLMGAGVGLIAIGRKKIRA
jgi:hypothetical protein